MEQDIEKNIIKFGSNGNSRVVLSVSVGLDVNKPELIKKLEIIELNEELNLEPGQSLNYLDVKNKITRKTQLLFYDNKSIDAVITQLNKLKIVEDKDVEIIDLLPYGC